VSGSSIDRAIVGAFDSSWVCRWAGGRATDLARVDLELIPAHVTDKPPHEHR
jgi:hypothetical protein